MTALYSDAALDEILRGDGRGGQIGLSAIDGLLAAVVAGPVRVSRPHWLAPIFNGAVPHTRPGTPEQRVVDTLVHRHDTVEDTLRRRPDLYSPVFMNHEGVVITHDWGVGFMMGMTLAPPSAWSRWLLPPKRQILLPILACTDLGESMLPDMEAEAIAEIRATAHAHIADAVVQLYRHTHNRPTPTPSVTRPVRRQ